MLRYTLMMMAMATAVSAAAISFPVKGSLVKLEPATGKAIASLQLGTELKSSPTISADGTIYVTGMLEGKPTLFAVEGAATGYAANAWSQMGGNPGKSGYMY